ncbi:MAG: hypothetical protein F4X57_10685 [Chloroflexi bacterium]|nr:hypothetical protein [Chloroflexota bacterium]
MAHSRFCTNSYDYYYINDGYRHRKLATVLGRCAKPNNVVTILIERGNLLKNITSLLSRIVSLFVLALLLLTLVFTDNTVLAQQNNYSQRDALCAIYDATGGDQWTINDGWCQSGTAFRDWYGVSTERLGYFEGVSSINLADNNLQGSLPSKDWVWKNFLLLKKIDVSDNRLTGDIPIDIARLHSVMEEINLSGNDISGSIPRQMGQSAKLKKVWLGDNELSGSIPSTLGNLEDLESLILSDNDLSGAIPSELGDLTNLRELVLNGNDLSGSIPANLSNLENLERLALNRNDLEGPIPANLSSMSKLKIVGLANNKLTGNIPDSFGMLSNLQRLHVHDNKLRGFVPVSLANLANMKSFDARNNKLCTPDNAVFRAWIATLDLYAVDDSNCPATDRAALEAIYQGMNGIEWPRQENWMSAADLSDWHGVDTDENGRVTRLDLSYNALAGEIPSEMKDLDRLELLDFSHNGVTGLPIWIAEMTELRGLMLSHNPIGEQSLPTALLSMPSLRLLQVERTGLCAPATDEFYEWMRSLDKASVAICQSDHDRNTLTELYDALGGSDWTRRNNWKSDEPLGNWEGIEVWNDGRVKSISLPRNNLVGEIPASIRNLDRLTELNLAGNGITGTIPSSIGELANLKALKLSHNAVGGGLPAEIGNISSLEELALEHTALAGGIPSSLTNLDNLIYLRFTGSGLCAPIDATFQNWLGEVGTVWGRYCEGAD